MKRFPAFMLLSLLFLLVLSVTAQDTLYTNRRGVRMRDEATTTAPVVTSLARGVAVTVIFSEDGSRVSGSTVWYYVTAGDYEGYIHSSLLTNVAPAAPQSSGSSGSGSSGSGGSEPIVQSTPPPLVEQPVAPPPAGASCNGATKCTQMTSCEQARACLAAGNGRLDGDNDGTPCESICGG